MPVIHSWRGRGWLSTHPDLQRVAMRSALVAITATQGGVFTRSQALAAGYTEREIRAHTRPGGAWPVVRAGVYCLRVDIEDLDTRTLWLLKDRAAGLTIRRPATASHDSAARLLEIDTLDPPAPASHFTVMGSTGSRTKGDLTRHRDLLPLCVEHVDDRVVTSYARTAIDIARWHGYRNGLVAIDSVRQRGVPLADLDAELVRMERHPHIARARAAVRDSDEGAESVLETLGRELVASLDIGDVDTQFAVRLAGERIVWCDLRVGCHIFECHGFVKLVPVGEGGVATELAERVLWKQQARETDIRAEGLGTSRIVWSDCFGIGREQAISRLRKEYAVTEARFGKILPAHLRRFAEEHPRRRAPRLWTPDLATAA